MTERGEWGGGGPDRTIKTAESSDGRKRGVGWGGPDDKDGRKQWRKKEGSGVGVDRTGQ